MGIGSVGFSFYVCVCVCVMYSNIWFWPVPRLRKDHLRLLPVWFYGFFSEKHRGDEVGAAVYFGNNGVPKSDPGAEDTPLQLLEQTSKLSHRRTERLLLFMFFSFLAEFYRGMG